MHNSLSPDPPQIRHRCRNPRCGGKLKTPTDNPRGAFCCEGCEIKKWRVAGYPLREIAVEFNVSISTVKRLTGSVRPFRKSREGAS